MGERSSSEHGRTRRRPMEELERTEGGSWEAAAWPGGASGEAAAWPGGASGEAAAWPGGASGEALTRSSAWSKEDLERIGGAPEIELVTLRADGSPRQPVTLWVVRVGDALYVRSWLGAAGAWYRHVRARPGARIVVEGREDAVRLVDPAPGIDDAVDAAYRAKYGALGGTYVEDMLSPDARATTLELVPERRKDTKDTARLEGTAGGRATPVVPRPEGG